MLVVINHGVDLRELPAVYMVEATPSNTTTMMLQERWKIHDWKMMDKIAELEKTSNRIGQIAVTTYNFSPGPVVFPALLFAPSCVPCFQSGRRSWGLI